MEGDDLDGFENYEDSAWFAAIRAADTWRDATAKSPKKAGDLNQLVDLLRVRLADAPAEVTMTRVECELLIDLLARHRLKQKPGGRKVPAYKRSSWTDLKLEIATESVRYYRRKGLKLDDAVKRVARENYVEAEPLRLRWQQRLHSDRRRSSSTIKPKP